MITIAAKKKTEPIMESRFTKDQLIASKHFANRKDLLNVLLVKEQSYNIEEVQKLIEQFMKGKVK